MTFVIAISTLGNSSRFEALLDSLNFQTDKNFVVGFCDQSERGELLDFLNNRALEFSFFVCRTEKRGLSRGRNEIIKNSPKTATHFLFPNDTSVFDDNFVHEVRAQSKDIQVTVLGYLESGRPRYLFPAGLTGLNRENVWLVLEGAVVISKDILEAGLGFDENLGVGSDGPFQSGEGSDLLLRTLPHIEKVRWVPDLTVNGVSQNFNLSPSSQRIKAFRYGVGYGHLLSRHRYSIAKKVKSLLGPLIRSAVPTKSRIGFIEAAYSTAGRLRGILYKSD